MKPKSPSLAALLFVGALACTDEVVQPPEEEPSCRQGRVWYRGACVDPAEIENETPAEPESCRMQDELICLERFVYWTNSCGILDEQPVQICDYTENCRTGSCEPGEVLFSDEFDSLSQWYVKRSTEAAVQDGVVEMFEGSLETRGEPYSFELTRGGHSLVLNLMARVEGRGGLGLSNLCTISGVNRVLCSGDTTLAAFPEIDIQDWHFYTLRLENVGDGYLDLHLAIDGQEDVAVAHRVPRVVLHNLGLILCWDADSPNRCLLNSFSLYRVDSWRPVED